MVVYRSMVWPCCLQRLHVEGVGEVRQAGSAWNLKGRKLELLDEEGNLIYQISIPCVLSSCFGTPVDFRLLDCNGEEVMPQNPFNQQDHECSRASVQESVEGERQMS
jgi:hypothetical protein